METLQASISVGMTKQVRQFEPVNIHVSVQNITKNTTAEEVVALLECKVRELAPVIGSEVARQVNAEVARQRGES